MVLRFHKTSVPGLRTFVQTEYEHSAKTVITGVRVGGQHKLITMSSRKSTFRVKDNANLQGLLDDLAKGCRAHYEMIDLALMEALYGIPYEADEPSDQPEPNPAPEEDSEPDSSDDFMDIVRSMKRVQPEPSPSERVPNVPLLRDPTQPAAGPSLPDAPPPLHDPPQSPADPCDVDGFLSIHSSLVDVFRKWKRNFTPRQEDQFLLRFAQDPPDVVINAVSRDVHVMSRSRTIDSKEQFPSSSSSVPRNKRRQSEAAGSDGAAPEANADVESSPPRVQVPKRQKKDSS